MPRTKEDVLNEIESTKWSLEHARVSDTNIRNAYAAGGLAGWGSDNAATTDIKRYGQKLMELQDELEDLDPVLKKAKEKRLAEEERKSKEAEERKSNEKRREQEKNNAEKSSNENRFEKMDVIASSASGYEAAGRLKPIRDHLEQYKKCVSVSESFLLYITKKGKVESVGSYHNGKGQCKTSGWRRIVEVCAGESDGIGLTANGKVVFFGWCFEKWAVGRWISSRYRKAVRSWKDIISISLVSNAYRGTNLVSCEPVGLKKDGTVVGVNGQYDKMKDIVAVSAGDGSYMYDESWLKYAYAGHVAGLRKDGTVVALWCDKKYYTGVTYGKYTCCSTENWRDIVAVSAGHKTTVGLKADGRVVAIGENNDKQCDVESWRNIVAVSAGYGRTLGLKADGTVVTTYEKDKNECSKWNNIIAIYNGCTGLKNDGTIVSTQNGIKKIGQRIPVNALVSQIDIHKYR